MAKRILDAEVTHVDQEHRIAVIVFPENDDAIMLPLDLLPDELIPGSQLAITIETL